MSETSYEVISLKGGRWITESIETSKEAALDRAEGIISSGLFTAVEILERSLDEESGKPTTALIYNKKKSLGREMSMYIGPERREGTEWRDDPKGYAKKAIKEQKQRRKSNFIDDFVKMVAGVGIAVSVVVVAIIWLATG